ncbi:hypothetical protein [Vaginisenegalia massiliensis]|uniref:hypothetical protein n=1 Tax=Vaginisenegalia massiliensis TaxID=2058294 RepID=UPI000F53FCA0|nr:hypothetical protein [Vaginisenegalia massiliensis]
MLDYYLCAVVCFFSAVLSFSFSLHDYFKNQEALRVSTQYLLSRELVFVGISIIPFFVRSPFLMMAVMSLSLVKNFLDILVSQYFNQKRVGRFSTTILLLECLVLGLYFS